MSTLIALGATVAGLLVFWAVGAIVASRRERRKNIQFFKTLDMIQNSKDPDEIIAIRDAYRDELGNPLNL